LLAEAVSRNKFFVLGRLYVRLFSVKSSCLFVWQYAIDGKRFLMNHADDNLDVNRVLRELFQAHGVEAILQGEWTQLPKSGMKASASIIQEITRPTSITAELEVRFEFAPGRTILEAFAGLGATKEATVRDAFGNFVTNSFHVLLSAFLRSEASLGDDEQVSQEEWLITELMRYGRLLKSSERVSGKDLTTLLLRWKRQLSPTAMACQPVEPSSSGAASENARPNSEE